MQLYHSSFKNVQRCKSRGCIFSIYFGIGIGSLVPYFDSTREWRGSSCGIISIASRRINRPISTKSTCSCFLVPTTTATIPIMQTRGGGGGGGRVEGITMAQSKIEFLKVERLRRGRHEYILKLDFQFEPLND